MGDSTSVIWAMWVPVVVFAHLFAFFWLAKTYLLNIGASGLFRRKKGHGKREASTSVSQPASPSLKSQTAVTVLPATGAPTINGAHQIDVLKSADQNGVIGKKGVALANGAAQDAVVLELDDGSSSDLFQDSEQQCALPASVTLQVEKVSLEWQGLGCSYNMAGGAVKVVLQGVWGKAQPSEMQALLGPSGAGKSTFMDMLAERKSVGNLTGELLVNGRPATKSFIRKTSYVPQEDNFVPTMTAEETLAFYASIVMPSSWPASKRRERATEVLLAMGMANARNTLVGGVLPGGLLLRGLSGGERKRLSIAAGILAAPSVLYLDEPTSGLDSFAALTVMGHLRRMARTNGHVIIASIHQPRSAIWMMFDTVTLLANGRLMYHGPRDAMLLWFASQGYVYDPALHGVPSDWALDLVAVGFSKPRQFYGHTMTTVEDLAAAADAFSRHYAQQLLAPGADAGGGGGDDKSGQALPGAHAVVASTSTSSGGDGGSSGVDAGSPRGGGVHGPKYASSTWTQFTWLLWRELQSITRNPADVAGRTLTFVWVGILLGLLYWGLPNDMFGVRNKLNILFNLQVFFCLMPYISMGLYTSDKKFYLADATAQLYRPLVYYVAKVCATTPFQLLSALVFQLTVYGMAGLSHGPGGNHAPVKNAFVSCMVYLIAVQVLHCCALLAPNQDIAFMLSIVWTAIQLLLSSFFIVFDEVYMYWLTYLRYVSALYYAFEGAASAEFRDAEYNCTGAMSDDQIALLRSAITSNNLDRGIALYQRSANTSSCTFHANAILDYFGFFRPFAHTAAILFGYLAIVHVMTYLVMVLVARRERR